MDKTLYIYFFIGLVILNMIDNNLNVVFKRKNIA